MKIGLAMDMFERSIPLGGVKPLLLVRPKHDPVEGAAEYLQRLTKMNGFLWPGDLLTILNTLLIDCVASGPSLVHEVLSGMSPTTSLREKRIAGWHFAKRLPVMFMHARVCPVCLSRSDVINALWSFPQSIRCSKHNCLLVDHCPDCQTQVARYKSMYRCSCGIEYAVLDVNPAPDWIDFYEKTQFSKYRASDDDFVLQWSHDYARAQLLTADLARIEYEKQVSENSQLLRHNGWISERDLSAIAAWLEWITCPEELDREDCRG